MSKIILDTEIISNQHLDLANGIEALCYHDLSISCISTQMNMQDHTKGISISLAPQKLKRYKPAIFERDSEGQERDLGFHHISAIKWRSTLGY